MPTILNQLIQVLPEDVPVRSVLVGAHWTVVCSRRCGMASTIMNTKPHGHHKVRDAGRLHRKTARELAEYALSDNLLEASIGVAAINSLLDLSGLEFVEMNASEVLAREGKEKKVAIVGSFPFIPSLRGDVGELWVIEQNPSSGEYPAHAAQDLIPQADIIAITGSALINHTLDELLSLCRPEAQVMVLGPSAPLSPVLFNYGADFISGTKVIDEAAVIRTVSQGANFQQVEGVRLLTIQRE